MKRLVIGFCIASSIGAALALRARRVQPMVTGRCIAANGGDEILAARSDYERERGKAGAGLDCSFGAAGDRSAAARPLPQSMAPPRHRLRRVKPRARSRWARHRGPATASGGQEVAGRGRGAAAAEAPANPGNPEATPIVVNGVMYCPSGQRVLALDAETGKELWRHELPKALRRPRAPWRTGLAIEECPPDYLHGRTEARRVECLHRRSVERFREGRHGGDRRCRGTACRPSTRTSSCSARRSANCREGRPATRARSTRGPARSCGSFIPCRAPARRVTRRG